MFVQVLLNFDFVISFTSLSKVRVLYGGTQLFDYQVADTISHDLRLCIPTGNNIYAGSALSQ